MPAYNDTRHSPHTAEELYQLVLDVKRYPEFLPWVSAIRILSQEEDAFLAEVKVRFKGLGQSYVSRVTWGEPTEEKPSYTVSVVMERGPFHHLQNEWEFTPEGEGCSISFSIDFAFKSQMLETMIGGLFDKAVRKMVEAFEDRATALYGKN